MLFLCLFFILLLSFSPHSLLCLRDWFLFSCFSIGPHRSVRVYSYSAVFSLSKAPKSSVHWQLLKHTVVVIFTSFFDRADVSGMFVCVFFFRMYWKLWETVAAEVANVPGYIIIMVICCYQTMKNGWSRREMFLGFFFFSSRHYCRSSLAGEELRRSTLSSQQKSPSFCLSLPPSSVLLLWFLLPPSLCHGLVTRLS